jgi:hypothetical protein
VVSLEIEAVRNASNSAVKTDGAETGDGTPFPSSNVKLQSAK